MFVVIGKNEFIANISIAYLVFTAFSGFILAILIRLGIVEITYSKNERKGFLFKMQQTVAKREKETYGNLFSERYYKTFEEDI